MWYKKGLRFQCTGCGKCCTGPSGYVWISDEEILTLAKTLSLSPEEFTKNYVRQIGDRLALKEVKRGEDFDCIFLKDKRCEVYQNRPVQCQKFPWWPQNLESQDSWDEAAKDCEGINLEEAPLLTFEEIEKQL